jgi:hypothetical protein
MGVSESLQRAESRKGGIPDNDGSCHHGRSDCTNSAYVTIRSILARTISRLKYSDLIFWAVLHFAGDSATPSSCAILVARLADSIICRRRTKF